MQKLYLVLLGFILILAFGLRFYKVADNPPSLNWDEVSIGYNAYSILKTGRDEWGQFMPFHFKSYGEYKLPVHIYASIPGIAIFGLNELGVRILPVLYGSITVLFMFFIGRAVFGSRFVGLLSAFFLAISPWHIQLTRGSFESSFATFWLSLGVWWLIKGCRGNLKWVIISMIPFAISVYTYNSARVFIPLFLISVLAIYYLHYKSITKHTKIIVYSILLFGVLLLPLVPFYLSGEGNSRYKLVSITDDPGLVPRINERRGKEVLPDPLPRLIHNKLTYIFAYFTQHYLAHFTPDFLFINGAPHKQHHVQQIGQLYWVQAPLLLLGLYFLFKKKLQFRWVLISWVMLAYIPVSITNDSIPHALRTLIAVPFYQLICAYGLFELHKLLKKRKKLLILIVGLGSMILIYQFFSYLSNYYHKYPISYSRDWQYGNKQVVEYIKEHFDEYDEIVYTRHFGEPHMFTLFYTQWDPLKFQNDPDLERFETFDWVRVLHFDKFYFPDLGDKGTRYEDIANINPSKKMLFIGKPGDFPEYRPILKTVNFLNGDKAFEIVENR